MELRKTTILPTDDAGVAERMLRHLIFEEPWVLLVVLGKGSEAETLVQRAAKLAGGDQDRRWVVWARDFALLNPVLGELKGERPASTARGFSISLSDFVADVIQANEPIPNLLRVLQAYAKAEQIVV